MDLELVSCYKHAGIAMSFVCVNVGAHFGVLSRSSSSLAASLQAIRLFWCIIWNYIIFTS
jgi:hypothetical protein